MADQPQAPGMSREEAVRALVALLTAQGAVVAALLQKAREVDPSIDAKLLAGLDEVLGRKLASRGGMPDPAEGETRKQLTNLLSLRVLPEAVPEAPTKITLRRRFRRWLEEG
jgi:hypothetical protein